MKDYIQITNYSHSLRNRYFSLKGGLEMRHYLTLAYYIIRQDGKVPFKELKQAREALAHVFAEDRFWVENKEDASKVSESFMFVLWLESDSRNLKHYGIPTPEPVKYDCKPPEFKELSKGSTSTWNARKQKFY